jgi:glyoxylase-like metal-dependent hydrolase (beta-lactamase superfamily II)
MNITRRDVLRLSTLTAATAVLARVPMTLAADDAPANPFGGKIEVTRLADDLHLIAGAGGNVTVSATAATGAIVIDAGTPERGAEILAQADKLIANARRRTLVNTHWHFDHAGGNAAFAAAGWDIVASTATRRRLGQRIMFEDLGMTCDPTPEGTWPTTTFDDRLVLHGPPAVTLVKVKPAHTDTDVIAFYEKYGVIHTGDVCFAGTFPVIDRTTGGSLDGMIAATKVLIDLCDDRTRVVPGHGPLGNKATLRAQYDLLRLAHDRLAPLAAQKKTMEAVVALAPFADLDDKWGRGFVRSPLFTRMAYGQWVK